MRVELTQLTSVAPGPTGTKWCYTTKASILGLSDLPLPDELRVKRPDGEVRYIFIEYINEMFVYRTLMGDTISVLND